VDIRELTDQALLLRTVTADGPDDSFDEVDRRFGDGATDSLSSYFTASHASPADAVRMVNEELDLILDIARDTHTHTARTDVPTRCRCGFIIRQ